MQDDPLRRLVKACARLVQATDLGLVRLLLRSRGEPRYLLGGACSSCGACCEHPTVQLPLLLFHLRSYRWVLAAWHRVVNGFDLERVDRRARALVFRCTHLDATTRACDSYASRPLMCRDYPRPLLYHARPEFFPDCTHRAVYRHGDGLDRALRERDLPPEQLRELRRRLNLEE